MNSLEIKKSITRALHVAFGRIGKECFPSARSSFMKGCVVGQSKTGFIAALWSFVAVPVGKGTQEQLATKAQLAPLRPAASQNHIPSRGQQTHLLFHIREAPGERRASPAEEVC